MANRRTKMFVGTIVDKDLSSATDKQIKAELNQFLVDKGAEHLLIDDDLSTLIELAGIYGDVTLHSEVDKVLESIGSDEEAKDAEYKRVGSLFRPKEYAKDRKLLEKLGEAVCSLHLDLDFLMKDQGIVFIDDTNAVFSFEQVRAIEDFPSEFSGAVILNKIKNKGDLKSVIDERYYESKKWNFLGKHNRCQGKYFTTAEFLDLISNRKIITFNRYE